MCLKTIKRKFVKRRKAYKIVRYHSPKSFGPLYFCTEDEWKPGIWYTASYRQVRCLKDTEKNKIHQYAYNSINLWYKFRRAMLANRPLPKNIVPVIRTESGFSYECGFHFFETLQEAIRQPDCKNFSNYKIVECQIKEVVGAGVQWNSTCLVARKMKIVRVVPEEEIKLYGR